MATLASGLKINELYYPEKKGTYVSAIQLTDRFKQVDIQASPVESGVTLLVTLEPWSPILRHQGLSSQDIHPTLAKEFRRLPVGRAMGDFELEKWRQELIRLGPEHGYPNLQLSFVRSKVSSDVDWNLNLGPPNRIQKIIIKGLETHPIQKRLRPH